MADGDAEITTFVVEGDGEFDADGRLVATQRVDDVRTYRVTDEDDAGVDAEGRRLALGVLGPGSILCEDCVVQKTLYPHETQRPGLYVCSAPEGPVVVKVYAVQYPPQRALWLRLPKLHHCNVLRVYRTVEDDGFFFEIQEYCAGGTLENRVPRPGTSRLPVPLEWVIDTVVPQLAAGLEYLHDQEIIHRDIKPANIYLTTRDGAEILVLGDFDIAAELESSRTSRDTQRAAGTWLYTAPEAFPRFVDDQASTRRGRVTRSADYYSLGITLIELLLGTTSLHACQLPDLFDFYLQGGHVEVPASLPGRLTLLLRGLLIRNRVTRWGAPEIARWQRNENSPRDLKHIQDDDNYQLARTQRPYRFGSQVALDLPSLADAMAREPTMAADDLLSGDILLNWVGSLDTNVARGIRRDREEWRRTPEMAVFCAIMHCDSTRPFVFAPGVEALDAQEWIILAIRLVVQRKQSPEEFCSPMLLRQFEWWLRLKADPEPALADSVARIQDTPLRAQLEEVAYLLQQERPYPIVKGVTARTPREYVAMTYGAPEEWKKGMPACYRSSLQRWEDGCLGAWLRQRGLRDLAIQCDQVAANLPGEVHAAFETILRLLDASLPLVEIEMNASEIAYPCSVPYQQARTFTIPYSTRGPGVPYGALQLDQELPGIHINQPTVRQREGKLEVTIDGRQNLPASKTFCTMMSFNSGIARMVNPPLLIRFRARFPWQTTVRRVAIGAGVGALALGVPRLVLAYFLLHSTQVIWYDEQIVNNMWMGIGQGQFPLVRYMIGVVVLGACLFLPLRLWFRAFRESEV